MNWLTFVGEGRSGHTILSGALGSHPNARISEEQKYIAKWRRGFTKDQILDALYSSGPGRTRKHQGWPNLCKVCEPVEVIGDKAGWDAVNEYRKRGAPQTVISEFSQFMGLPVKVVVTVRDPINNISSWASGRKYKRIYRDEDFRVKRLIRRYRRFYNAAWEILQGTDFFVVYHEKFIENPNSTLQRLSDWLGLSKDKNWRRSSGSRIWSKPRDRKRSVNWSESNLDYINDHIQKNPLMGYYR